MIDEKKLIAEIKDYIEEYSGIDENGMHNLKWCAMMEALGLVEQQEKVGEWIPCSERLPEDLTPVNITWTNHFPPDYYAHIKDVHFTYTGIFYKGKWYWWSAYAKDTLAEYGNDEVDEMADEIEVLAWQTLPEPWEGEADE